MKKLKSDILHNIMQHFEETIVAYVNNDEQTFERCLTSSLFSSIDEMYEETKDNVIKIDDEGYFTYKGHQFHASYITQVDCTVFWDEEPEVPVIVTYLYGSYNFIRSERILSRFNKYLEYRYVHN